MLLTISLITTSCDSGRVIDEDERRRVLSKHGQTETQTDWDADFALIRDSFTSQSEYHYFAYYIPSDWSYVGQLKVESLIRLDGRRNPIVSSGLMQFEIPCNDHRADNNHCAGWSRTFKAKELFYNVPDFDLTLSFLPSYQYVLHLRTGERLQTLAEYQIFKMFLSSGQHHVREFLVKQKFYNSHNLIPGLGRTVFSSDAVSAQDLPFLDLIYFNHPYFPSPRTELSLIHFEKVQQGAQVLELKGHFHNHLTDEAEDYTFIVEML